MEPEILRCESQKGRSSLKYCVYYCESMKQLRNSPESRQYMHIRPSINKSEQSDRSDSVLIYESETKTKMLTRVIDGNVESAIKTPRQVRMHDQ